MDSFETFCGCYMLYLDVIERYQAIAARGDTVAEMLLDDGVEYLEKLASLVSEYQPQ